MASQDPSDTPTHPVQWRKGRGALSRPGPRYSHYQREAVLPDDAHTQDADDSMAPPLPTVVVEQNARSIIRRNTSPDIPFEQSINPYQGCEHGCVYCYARPTHAYLDLSPGLDFETRIFAKTNAAALLRAELRAGSYRPDLIVLGSNTDPYQPAERKLGITRQVLEVLADHRLPVGIITKSALVTRDLDLLQPMAARGLVQVNLSVTTLDASLARKLDPRASAPASRLQAIRKLAEAGVPVGVFASPMIPALNDTELEKILEAAAQAGARYASYVLLRLPLEVRDLFVQWLEQHYPLRADHVMHRLQDMRNGRDYDPSFSTRMKGSGLFADLLAQRFARALKRYGLDRMPVAADTSQFTRPPQTDDQLPLW